jgi:hypothetical protein
MNSETREPKIDPPSDKGETSPPQKERATKWALILGCVLAASVVLIDPSTRTVLYMGVALVALASALLLRKFAARSRLFSLRVSPQIALLVTTVVICILAAEICLRLFVFQTFSDLRRNEGLGQNLGYQYDKTLGWFPIPNSQRTFTASRTISISHNRAGFRDPEPLFDSKLRIAFVGDSYTWGYDAEAEERFTEKLRAKHPEWRIYNLGVCGYSTDQEFLLLQKVFDEYKPDFVFLVFCTENDDGGNCSNSGGGIYFKPYYESVRGGLKLRGVPVPGSDKVFCLGHPVLSKSYLIRLCVRAYDNIADPPPRFTECPTSAIISEMQKYVASKGASFAVGLTDNHPELEKFLAQTKIPYVNLATSLRTTVGDHWSAEGHTFVADKVEPILLSDEHLRRK